MKSAVARWPGGQVDRSTGRQVDRSTLHWTLHWTVDTARVTFAVGWLAGGPAWETKEGGCEGGQWSREELCFHIRTDWEGAMLEITAAAPRTGTQHIS